MAKKTLTVGQMQARAEQEAEQTVIDKAIAFIRPIQYQRIVQDETGQFVEIDKRELLTLTLDLERAVDYYDQLILTDEKK